MLSAATNVASLPFAPTPATLDEALALLEERGPLGGGAVEPARRREALARYSVLPAPGGRPGRGWRHDYTRVAFDGLQWTSGRLALDTVPFREVAREAPDAHVDRPALATENVAGIIHRGATLLESPQGAIRGSTSSDPRIVVVPLSDAVRSHAALVARATQNAAPERRDDRFAALSTAFQNCGVFVYVPDGVVLDAPIQLLFANGGDDEAVFPHVVVVLGAGARASVLERHAGGGDPFVCGLVDALCEEGAQLEYGVVQTAGEGTRLAFWRDAQLGRDARIRWSIAELGGTLSRCVVTAGLDAPGAKAETSALFFNTGMQHVDLATTIEHRVGSTESNTVVRSAATDRGQGRFVGNIAIRPHAHGADATLRDDALLLSRRAHIDSIPALEIAANDVRAFHGATVGSLDETALFYAASRGIARPDALRMVTLGFFEPAIARFPGEPLRDEVRTALDAKIDDATELDA